MGENATLACMGRFVDAGMRVEGVLGGREDGVELRLLQIRTVAVDCF